MKKPQIYFNVKTFVIMQYFVFKYTNEIVFKNMYIYIHPCYVEPFNFNLFYSFQIWTSVYVQKNCLTDSWIET